ERGRSGRDGFRQVRVGLRELRWRPVPEPEQIREDEDLRVRARSGADADRRDVERAGDQLADGPRNALQHEGERARLLQRERVVQEPPRVFLGAALDAVAAYASDGLR